MVLRVITRVGVGAVTVVLGPNSLPETIVTAGGVMVEVVSTVSVTVAVVDTTTVFVILLHHWDICSGGAIFNLRRIISSVRSIDCHNRLIRSTLDNTSMRHTLSSLLQESLLVNLDTTPTNLPSPKAA